MYVKNIVMLKFVIQNDAIVYKYKRVMNFKIGTCFPRSHILEKK